MVVSCVTCHCGAKGSWCLLVTSRSFFCEVGGRRGQRINKPTSCRVLALSAYKMMSLRVYFVSIRDKKKRCSCLFTLPANITINAFHLQLSSAEPTVPSHRTGCPLCTWQHKVTTLNASNTFYSTRLLLMTSRWTTWQRCMWRLTAVTTESPNCCWTNGPTLTPGHW